MNNSDELYAQKSHTRTNPGTFRMTRVVRAAVRLHHFRFHTWKNLRPLVLVAQLNNPKFLTLELLFVRWLTKNVQKNQDLSDIKTKNQGLPFRMIEQTT